jgi:spoIIIJ-associated protein
VNDDLLALAKVRLEEVLAFFQIDSKVRVSEEGNQIQITVETPSSARLIGHHGETLQALQHLLGALIRRHSETPVYVSLDIAGYKQALADRLAAKANEAAAKAIETGKEQYLRPMTASERRLVHMALAAIPGVVTESIGEDPYRRVIIKKREP